MRFLLNTFFFVVTWSIFAQETTVPDFEAVDSLYREDQFYVGFTYNILINKEDGISQNKFSAGLTGGFLRDMPLNKSRNIAIAAGIGYTMNNYNHNIVVSEAGGVAQYNFIEAGSGYDKNKLSLHFVDLPIEFRWRTSTPNSHKFWRIYTGIKVSYLFYSRSKFVDDQQIVVTGNEDLNKIRYGVYLSTGYNTWNAHIYYGLNPVYKSGTLAGQPLDMQTLNIGLMFYIL